MATVTDTSTYQTAEGTVTVKGWSDGSTTYTGPTIAFSDIVASGLILPSPDGTYWRLAPDNTGSLGHTNQGKGRPNA